MYKLGLIVLLAGACLGAPRVPDSRIIGGEAAAPGEIPTIVSLRSASTNRHFCGGSVLNENWILTAAHCIVGSSASSILVVSGTNQQNSGGQSNAVSRVITHSGYSASAYWRNDIGLLQLATPLVLSELVQPIVLPESGRAQGAGLAVLATGWGYTTYPGWTIPNDLQKLELNLVSNEDCQVAHPSAIIYDTSVCALAGVGKAVCNGDSGSPLLEAGSNVIVGIVSWGLACAHGVPDVYTRVSQYIDWIQDNAQ